MLKYFKAKEKSTFKPTLKDLVPEKKKRRKKIITEIFVDPPEPPSRPKYPVKDQSNKKDILEYFKSAKQQMTFQEITFPTYINTTHVDQKLPPQVVFREVEKKNVIIKVRDYSAAINRLFLEKGITDPTEPKPKPPPPKRRTRNKPPTKYGLKLFIPRETGMKIRFQMWNIPSKKEYVPKRVKKHECKCLPCRKYGPEHLFTCNIRCALIHCNYNNFIHWSKKINIKNHDAMVFDDGFSPVHVAAMYDTPLFLRKLKKLNFNFNIKNNDLDTPLHIAIKHGWIANVFFLIRTCNADVAALNRKGETPLILALRYDRYEIAKFLLENGAQVDQTSFNPYCSYNKEELELGN